MKWKLESESSLGPKNKEMRLKFKEAWVGQGGGVEHVARAKMNWRVPWQLQQQRPGQEIWARGVVEHVIGGVFDKNAQPGQPDLALFNGA